MRTWWLIAAVAVLAFGCEAARRFPYQFSGTQGVVLPKKLNEISGLCWMSDSTLACVQDERAELFTIHAQTGKILSHFDFGKDADYEGIAFHGDTYYALRSDGRISAFVADSKAYAHIKFPKGHDHDFEGLCVSPDGTQLLVACKTYGKKKKRDHILIYRFDLSTETYDREPWVDLDADRVHPGFKSSGIAVHPDGNIYVLSSASKTLLVLDGAGQVLQFTQLDKDIYHQPEGICFAPNGVMYIANERRNDRPTLLQHAPKK